jgi:hypothetical protein
MGAGRNLNLRPVKTSEAISELRLDIDDYLDDYLHWTITEGGLLAGTSMPPFVGALQKTQSGKFSLLAFPNVLTVLLLVIGCQASILNLPTVCFSLVIFTFIILSSKHMMDMQAVSECRASMSLGEGRKIDGQAGPLQCHQ